MEQTQAISNPAGEAARTEMQRVMTDPQHPLHGAYRRGDNAAVDKHITPFYERAYGRGQVEIGNPVFTTDPDKAPSQLQPDASLSREDRVAQTEVETMLNRTLGDDYEPEMRHMRIGANHLFSIPDGEKVLDALSPLITDLGPQVEVACIRFLAHLGRLRTNKRGA